MGEAYESIRRGVYDQQKKELTSLRAENASLKALLAMAEEGLEYATTWAPMTLTCRTRLIEALAAIRAKGGEIVKAKDFYAERERAGEVKAVKSAPVESTINLIDAVEAWMLAAPAIEREVSAQGGPVAFPALPAGIVKHDRLGELYDRLQVHQYAMKYAMLYAPPVPAEKAEPAIEREVSAHKKK